MKKKFLLVLSIICAVLFAATVFLTVYMANSTSLVVDTGIKTGQQNNIIGYDSDNETLFIGTRTGSLLAYDNNTHQQKWEVTSEGGQPFTSLKVHAATGKVYAGNDDQMVYVIDISTGSVQNTINVKGRVLDFDITEDETVLAAVTKTNSKSNIRVFDMANGEQIANNKYSYLMKGVFFTADGENLLAVSKRGEIMRLTYDGKIVENVNDVLKTEIMALKSANDGEYLAVDKNGKYAIFDENCKILRRGAANMVSGSEVYSGCLDSAGNVIIGTKQGYVYVINPADKQIYSYRQENVISVSDFVPDGNVMYITGYGDFVEQIELSSLTTIATLQSMSAIIKILMILFAVGMILLAMLYFVPTYKLLCRFGKTFWKHKLAYFLLVPTFVILILFNYTPVVMALTRAFTNWSVKNYTTADLEFAGLSQFKSALQDTYFLYGVQNLLVLMVTGFVKLLTMPLLAAWLVYSFRGNKKKYIFRFLYVLPIVVPGVVGALLWKEIYNPGGGADQILTTLGLQQMIHVWLGEEKTALWAIIFMGIPYIGALPFLLYYGGLTSIDGSLYEAAKIDGANRHKIFWKIQLPMIMPQIKLLIVLQFIGSIQDYGSIYLMTGGGPGHATYTPGLALYYDATANGQYARACAMGLMMFVVIMIGTYFNQKIQAENYGS